MKYFETIHERNSARITALIVIILVLLIFVMGPKYIDPPLEYGVAVNFGTTDFGSGTIQPTQPIKADPVKNTEDSKPEEVEQVSETTDSKAEDVLTNESAETIAIRKQKEAEAKAEAEAERIERERIEAEEKKRQEEAEKKKALDDLIGGVSNSEGPPSDGEGPDSESGDKGDLDGNPYGPYQGRPGTGNGGAGYGLNGRGKPSFTMHEGCENEYGLIVVDIVVDRSGQVVDATPGAKGSNNATSCLNAVAKKIALSYKWPADTKAPSRQYGKVSINFTPSN
ncbi:energy transducer TonB [Flavobacteriales bacterium 34_180_T64]|nr:energy transducer TonB [Flavobacteriales bacterium 34_180_T64]